jgi:co-chaperonin GroES (HSP10)
LTNFIAVCKCAVQLEGLVLGVMGGGGMEKLTRGMYVEVGAVEVDERGDAEVWDVRVGDEVSVVECEEEARAVEVDV